MRHSKPSLYIFLTLLFIGLLPAVFSAQPVLKWSYNLGSSASIGPLAVDVNKDGVYEVFATSEGKVASFNGTSGKLLWSYSNSAISLHAPYEIKDLNNDGTPELVIASGLRTIALHANDGSVYWNVPVESADKHLVIVDTEGNGYPYVYIASSDVDHMENGTGRLRKLRGTDGKVMAETFAWRPCWGGLSAADANNDGKFEIYMTDRDIYYHPPNLAMGLQAYDADNLTLLWNDDELLSSSHTAALIDVNGDGVLDAVIVEQIENGIYALDGITGERIYAKSNLNLTGHSQFSIWDIDNDGKLELITSSDAPAKVWELGTWKEEATLAFSGEPPKMADVLGDSNLEIILADGGRVKIYDNKYNLLENWAINAQASTLVQDIDKDGLNELVVISGGGLVQAYELTSFAPTPRVRTDSLYYSERNLGVGVYIPPIGAPQPIIKEETPINKSTDVALNPDLSVRVVDFRYDKMNIEISLLNKNGEWVSCSSFTNVGNARYTCKPKIFNESDTTYYWKVIAVDPNADNIQTTAIYKFATKQSMEAPYILNELPLDNNNEVPTTTNQLKFMLVDNQNNLINYTVVTSPNIGSASRTMVPNGNYSVNISNLALGATYNWTVTATDGQNIKSRTFTFTTIGLNKLNINSIGNGSVNSSNATYVTGTNVSLKATPGNDWKLMGWKGLINSLDNPLKVLMDSDKTLTAVFYKNESDIYLIDTGYDFSVDSIDLRENNLWQDWYESRNNVPAQLTLDETNIGGNTGKKVKFTSTTSGDAYLTQEFRKVINDTAAFEWDIYVDEITDITGSPDRAGWTMIGDDSVVGSGPNADSDRERFVNIGFGKEGGGTTGTMNLIVRDRDDPWTLATNVTKGLNLDQWYKIKVILNFTAQTYDIYVNDTYQGTVTSRANKSSVTHISFVNMYDGTGTFYVDNIKSVSGTVASCTPGEMRNCEKQAGVCTGIKETCNNQSVWSGCNYFSIPTYQVNETSCDNLDNDCDDNIDENLLIISYKDSDADTYGNAASINMSCILPSGYVLNNQDCDDTNSLINPGATEIQDGKDNDCDGQIDEGFMIGNWSNKKKITIDHTKVTGDLTGFPVLIDITDTDLSKAQPDGDDIYFTLSDNETKIAHEIETYDNNHLVAWVKVPQLSSVTDTIIYMYYGNMDAGSQETPEGVWDSSYLAVQHMEESTGNALDSTSYNNDGSLINSVTQGVSGKVDGAYQFNGVDQRLSMPRVLTSEPQFTYEAWVNTENKQGYIITEWASSNGAFLQYYPQSFQLYVNGVHIVKGTTPGVWQYVVGTYDGSTARLYVNNEAVVSAASTAPVWPNANMIIGDRPELSRGFQGKLDEIKISGVARSDAYIRTSYNNQNSPSTFISVGSEESLITLPECTSGQTRSCGSDVGECVSGTQSCLITGFWNTVCVGEVLPATEIQDGKDNDCDGQTDEGFMIGNWSYKKNITIDHTKVSGDLVGFPVLIDITDSALANNSQSDGDDIYFTLSDNVTKLSHEIETYNNGHLVAWVKVPQLSSVTDTTLYMFYGNSGVGPQENAEGVWDSDYLVVHHMEESTGNALDSTSNSNDGTVINSVIKDATGKIDGAYQFNGVDQRVSMSRVLTSEPQFTYEAWVNTENKQGYIITEWASSNGAFLQYYPQSFQLYVNGVHIVKGTTPGVWQYVVGTYDGITARLYVNNEAVVSAASTAPVWPNANMIIGDRPELSRGFQGKLDEIKISSVARSDAYIRTSYNNQNSPSTFYNVGSQESG